jgi:ankyrin repeat protein
MAASEPLTLTYKDGFSQTPLWSAAKNGYLAKVKQLLEAGADICQRIPASVRRRYGRPLGMDT